MFRKIKPLGQWPETNGLKQTRERTELFFIIELERH